MLPAQFVDVRGKLEAVAGRKIPDCRLSPISHGANSRSICLDPGFSMAGIAEESNEEKARKGGRGKAAAGKRVRNDDDRDREAYHEGRKGAPRPHNID